MQFNTAPAPHLAPQQHLRGLMRSVLMALIPGIAAQIWQFGPGVLIQCCLAALAAVSGEALMLKLRGRRPLPTLLDCTALITAILLAIAVPPLLPGWAIVFGTLFAIIIGKHLYGGLGHNPFNPAMLGYAVLLISFPRQMTEWQGPLVLLSVTPDLSETYNAIVHSTGSLDALAMATPLGDSKTQLALSRSLDEIHSSTLFSDIGGTGWQWVNFGFLLGGMGLLQQRIIAWQIPAGFLGTLFVASFMGYLFDPLNQPTPLFHLFSGGTMLGAFFIATDPVTAATTRRGRLIFGSGIGLLVFIIRSWGGYPDGVAFAVLLFNLAAPTIDYYSRPRVYGHSS
jgi:electron transport complex protein RnfD